MSAPQERRQTLRAGKAIDAVDLPRDPAAGCHAKGDPALRENTRCLDGSLPVRPF